MKAVVVGTGRMAPGIAMALAGAAAEVTIAGRSFAHARAAALAAGGSTTAAVIEAATFLDADLVVETIVEDPSAKQLLYATIEPWLPPDAVLTTNTSGLRVSALASTVGRPESFAGLHFLNPAGLTRVVEVVAGEHTSEATTSYLISVVRSMRREPVVVERDVPGFVWNRLQLALLREALWLLDEGVADARSIDAAVSDGLAARWISGGPFVTIDLDGIRTWRTVAEEVFPHLAVDSVPRAALARRADVDGAFYRWDDRTRAAAAELRAEGLDDGARTARKRQQLDLPLEPDPAG